MCFKYPYDTKPAAAKSGAKHMTELVIYARDYILIYKHIIHW